MTPGRHARNLCHLYSSLGMHAALISMLLMHLSVALQRPHVFYSSVPAIFLHSLHSLFKQGVFLLILKIMGVTMPPPPGHDLLYKSPTIPPHNPHVWVVGHTTDRCIILYDVIVLGHCDCKVTRPLKKLSSLAHVQSIMQILNDDIIQVHLIV